MIRHPAPLLGKSSRKASLYDFQNEIALSHCPRRLMVPSQRKRTSDYGWGDVRGCASSEAGRPRGVSARAFYAVAVLPLPFPCITDDPMTGRKARASESALRPAGSIFAPCHPHAASRRLGSSKNTTTPASSSATRTDRRWRISTSRTSRADVRRPTC
jgi:hypothetical protein